VVTAPDCVRHRLRPLTRPTGLGVSIVVVVVIYLVLLWMVSDLRLGWLVILLLDCLLILLQLRGMQACVLQDPSTSCVSLAIGSDLSSLCIVLFLLLGQLSFNLFKVNQIKSQSRPVWTAPFFPRCELVVVFFVECNAHILHAPIVLSSW
jgi:hypothetical protein